MPSRWATQRSENPSPRQFSRKPQWPPQGAISSRAAKFSYGPLLRWARHWNIKRDYDKEPEWRHNRAELTTGYAKRW